MITIEYRDLSKPEEMKEAVETLQSAFTDIPDIEVIPDHIFTAAAKTGILVGAYQDEDQIGFAMGVGDLKRKNNAYLHAIGVKEDYKNESVGEELLRRFGKRAKERDLDTFTLTYDPLLGGNANLNISKAGGNVRNYEKNLYGRQENEANSGETPTDRFEVEFNLSNDDVERFLEGDQADSENFKDLPKVLEMDSSGKRPDIQKSVIKKEDSNERHYSFDQGQFQRKFSEADYVGVEIPRDLSTIKESGTEEEVRYATRKVFDELINERGYEVIDFVPSSRERFVNNTYVLEGDSDV